MVPRLAAVFRGRRPIALAAVVVAWLFAGGCVQTPYWPDDLSAYRVNAYGTCTYTRMYAAACADNPARIEELVASGAKLTRGNALGASPLHGAAKHGAVAAIETLVRLGHPVRCRGAHDATPLHYACRWYRPDAARKLIALGADVEARDDAGDPALACLGTQLAAALSTGPADRTDRDWARAFEQYREVVLLLLDAGSDPNHISALGSTPLVEACRVGDDRMAPVVALLLARGADVNRHGPESPSARDWAEHYGATAVIDLLVRAGAEPGRWEWPAPARRSTGLPPPPPLPAPPTR